MTMAGRAVGADMRVEGDGEFVRPVADVPHPGQPERETAEEILGGGPSRPAAQGNAAKNEGKPKRKGLGHDVLGSTEK